ncbi:hypothetical protein CC1G_06424 [Coprinopsis cinerea okayama7|uniref:Selenoprotein O n=1 Tax=Coprinopsis cinerea (strain Okayama-7 / 130 / ATCC MYA-4618 / FGSC 9003) TaxID=240176 RepID=A8NTZ2_COPC7|nr:hypothetical protein CC1G_06424 [Coprinopsis cinerea okayama7\|eukprot:XP_001836339.1 hypothetical protein CC1G_06424 [Coprinopsis cinerea okayama7\
MSKLPISALPIPPPSRLLIHNLTPDTWTPNPTAFRTNVLTTTPSLQRRARLLSPPCHYSHVTPFPVSFPYDIQPPSPSDDPANQDKNAYIERWLASREAVNPQPPIPRFPNSTLVKYYGKHRDQPTELLGLSETALRDCLPHLDVGDAFATLGVPSLSDEFNDEGDGKPSEIAEAVEARQDLIDVLSGHATLMTPPEVIEGAFAPWSLRYSGHQFGSWAGQLGDGRAISILVTPHPSHPDLSYELQLKGSGRTPFSRSADGLAVVRSSIREYLCSEAMYALGIPTTRALSIVSLPALPVQRERVESASIVTRLAPSFIRIGNFEAFNGPTNMFFFGGGQQKPDYEGLRMLGEWVVGNVLNLSVEKGKPWGAELVYDVARRNAKMVAGWQAYGFMHGVINTDNVSILGLTIDYGPYAFMDVFDPLHICNHTDEGGRYAYKYQPNMIIYALRALLKALAPLIGAEIETGKAVSAGWAEDASPEKIKEWTAKGLEIKDEMERIIQQTCSTEYGDLLRKRLGLHRPDPTDESKIFRPLLDIMEGYGLDFHSTFRILSSFKASTLINAKNKGTPNAHSLAPEVEAFINRLLTVTPEPEKLNVNAAKQQWIEWLETYSQRIKDEHGDWKASGWQEDLEGTEIQRQQEMRGVNPRFVLRQWVLEEVIKRVERDVDSGKRVLAKVLHMACNPFEPWGGEDADELEALDKEEKEEKRFCGLGEKKMLGFQCSCSS